MAIGKPQAADVPPLVAWSNQTATKRHGKTATANTKIADAAPINPHPCLHRRRWQVSGRDNFRFLAKTFLAHKQRHASNQNARPYHAINLRYKHQQNYPPPSQSTYCAIHPSARHRAYCAIAMELIDVTTIVASDVPTAKWVMTSLG